MRSFKVCSPDAYDARRDFALELDKQRTSMQLAEERSRASEKRMLLDMDRERTTLAKLQKELDAHAAGALRTVDQHRQELNLLQQALGDSRQKNGQLEGALQTVTASLERADTEAKQMQTQLSESSAQTVLFRSQAEGWRRQFEELQELQRKNAQTTKATARKPRRP